MIVLAELRLTNCVHVVDFTGSLSDLLIGRCPGEWVWSNPLRITMLPQQSFIKCKVINFVRGFVVISKTLLEFHYL